jgi:putative spermidine/putrescine transport system permease protein
MSGWCGVTRREGPWRAALGWGFALWLVLPLVPIAVWSVARGWRFPALTPNALTWEAWAFALSPASGVLASLGLTIGIAAATTALAAVIGVPAGRALALHRFPGRGLVLLLVLAPAILPGIAVALGLHGLFLRLGLTGTVPGVILAHLIPVLPYMVLVMTAVFTAFDPRVEDQARSLGARPYQVFVHVTLPAILPGLLTGALFAFLVSWSQYLLTLTIGAGRVQTLPLTLYAFANAGRNDITGAVAVITLLPGVLILLVTARQLTGRHAALATRGGR